MPSDFVPTADAALGSATVLIIDDDTMIAAALSTRLRASGFGVHTATDGRRGLAAAGEHAPDVIILDVRAPDLDGFAVHRLLRADPALASIPVVFLSGGFRESARQAALGAGATAFLSKPYEYRDVLAAIEHALAA